MLCLQTTANFLKVSCEYDEKYLKDVICELKPIKRYIKIFRVNATIYRPITDVYLQMANLRKTSANRYMPGLFNITLNLCELVEPGSEKLALFRQIIGHFYSNQSSEVLGLFDNFRHCPFEGKIHFDERRNEEPTVGLSFAEPGEYLTDLRLITSQRKLYIGLKVFSLIKIAGMN
jgi:hypothetical protein